MWHYGQVAGTEREALTTKSNPVQWGTDTDTASESTTMHVGSSIGQSPSKEGILDRNLALGVAIGVVVFNNNHRSSDSEDLSITSDSVDYTRALGAGFRNCAIQPRSSSF